MLPIPPFYRNLKNPWPRRDSAGPFFRLRQVKRLRKAALKKDKARGSLQKKDPRGFFGRFGFDVGNVFLSSDPKIPRYLLYIYIPGKPYGHFFLTIRF